MFRHHCSNGPIRRGWCGRACWYLLALVLAGCGGAADPTDLGGTRPPPVRAYDAYAIAETAMQQAWMGQPPTDPASLPVSGSAAFAGVMSLQAETAGGAVGLKGAVNLTANFAAATIGGAAGGFRDSANNAYQGTLNLAQGRIDRAANPALAPTFDADLAGTLTGADNTLDIDAYLTGDFLGPGAEAAAGAFSGLVDTPGLVGGYLFGEFIAER